MHKYGIVIKRKRTAQKKTQAEYASLLGMKQANYARLEKGELDIKLSQIEKICDKLEISADELLGRK